MPSTSPYSSSPFCNTGGRVSAAAAPCRRPPRPLPPPGPHLPLRVEAAHAAVVGLAVQAQRHGGGSALQAPPRPLARKRFRPAPLPCGGKTRGPGRASASGAMTPPPRRARAREGAGAFRQPRPSLCARQGFRGVFALVASGRTRRTGPLPHVTRRARRAAYACAFSPSSPRDASPSSLPLLRAIRGTSCFYACATHKKKRKPIGGGGERG